MLGLCRAERRPEGSSHCKKGVLKGLGRTKSASPESSRPDEGDFEEAALGPSPQSRPARGLNAKPPGGRPTEHSGARRTPRRPSPVTCRNLRPSVSSAGRAGRGSSAISMAAGANDSPAARLSSALPVRPFVHVALAAAAVLTYRGSTCLKARPTTEGVWLEGVA